MQLITVLYLVWLRLEKQPGRWLTGRARMELGCWSGLPSLPPGDLPDSGIELGSPVSPALAGGFFTTEPPGKPYY